MKIIYLCNYYDMMLKLKNFMSINTINQQNDVLYLIVIDNFDQNLKNLSSNLQSLTLSGEFNQNWKTFQITYKI